MVHHEYLVVPNLQELFNNLQLFKFRLADVKGRYLAGWILVNVPNGYRRRTRIVSGFMMIRVYERAKGC